MTRREHWLHIPSGLKGKRVTTKRHKMHKRLFCAFCAVLWLIPASFAQEKYSLDQIFGKMDEVQKTFRSVVADIDRTHVTVLVDDKDVSSGKFYYVRQAKEPRLKLELQ